jgi:hypothetical protein
VCGLKVDWNHNDFGAAQRTGPQTQTEFEREFLFHPPVNTFASPSQLRAWFFLRARFVVVRWFTRLYRTPEGSNQRVEQTVAAAKSNIDKARVALGKVLARMCGPQTHDHVMPNAEGGTEGCSSSTTSTTVAPTPQPLGGTMVADNEGAGETSPRHLIHDPDESLTASGRTSTLRRSARRRLSESASEDEGNMQDVGGSGMEDGDLHDGAASNAPATTNTLLRGWECPACTLVNAPGENLCAACSRRCR